MTSIKIVFLVILYKIKDSNIFQLYLFEKSTQAKN